MNRFVCLVVLAACTGRCSPAPAVPQASADTWAVVDGHEIKRDDVEKAYRQAAPPTAQSDDAVLAAKLTLLNELIARELLISKARQLKIELSDTELDTAYADAKK